MSGVGLSRLSRPDLEALLHAIERGGIDCPLTETGLRAGGFARASADVLIAFDGVDASGAKAALRIAIAEREHRPPPHLDLVWTGPEARYSTARDTGIVVQQLFERARSSVVVGGFRFDHGEDLFRPLHAVMRDHGVHATLFLDISDRASDGSGAERIATQFIDRFFRDNWPFEGARPAVYYDPRTAAPGPPWVSLHAKCVVVDEELTFVTSANFTDRGQTRNLELGVLVKDADFARAVLTQWNMLVSDGLVRRYGDRG